MRRRIAFRAHWCLSCRAYHFSNTRMGRIVALHPKYRPHGPMKAQRNVHNYVEKCITSHEAKTEV